MVNQDIQSVELLTIKRGLHKVLVNWKSSREQGSITFYTKKEAQQYYKWITQDRDKNIDELALELIKMGLI